MIQKLIEVNNISNLSYTWLPQGCLSKQRRLTYNRQEHSTCQTPLLVRLVGRVITNSVPRSGWELTEI